MISFVQNYGNLNIVSLVALTDWEAVLRLGKLPCPACELVQGEDSGEDRVPNSGTESDARDFALCQVMSMMITHSCCLVIWWFAGLRILLFSYYYTE
jgi:hypothetical protein